MMYDSEIVITKQVGENAFMYVAITKLEVITEVVAPCGDKPLRYETFVKAYHDPVDYHYPIENIIHDKMSIIEFLQAPISLISDLRDTYEEELEGFVYDDSVADEVYECLRKQEPELFESLPELSWCESGMSSEEHYHLIFGTW